MVHIMNFVLSEKEGICRYLGTKKELKGVVNEFRSRYHSDWKVTMKKKDKRKSIIRQELEKIKKKPYNEIRMLALSKKIDAYSLNLDGSEYSVEIEYFWDNEDKGHIRVSGGISDVSSFLSSIFPTCDDFIIRPDGTFIG